MNGSTWRFRAETTTVPDRQRQLLALRPLEDVSPAIAPTADGGLTFLTPGWYEVMLTVAWDPGNRDGSRFSHTKTPDGHPLHSEVVDAAVLSAVSDGRQLLRANSVFGPGGPQELSLEVWQDSGQSIAVRMAELAVRCLS